MDRSKGNIRRITKSLIINYGLVYIVLIKIEIEDEEAKSNLIFIHVIRLNCNA